VAGTCHIDVMPLSYRAGAFKKYPVRSRPRRRPIPSVAQFRRVRGAATRSISATKINRRESIFGKAGSIGFGAPRSPVPEFPVPALKRFALRGASPDSNYVGNRTLCGRYSVHQRGVASPLFRAQGFTMLPTYRPTPTCTRFQATIEMPCMKCGVQMRLALIEPQGPSYNLLTYSCVPCDSGESFLKAM
jgi:hypothetical protein